MKAGLYLLNGDQRILCLCNKTDSRIKKENRQSEYNLLCEKLRICHIDNGRHLVADLYRKNSNFEQVSLEYETEFYTERRYEMDGTKAELCLYKKDDSREVLNTYEFRLMK